VEPEAPKTYSEFIDRFPSLGRAWELLHEGGDEAGPLDARTMRLIKLAVSIGAMREGATRAGARKALAEGISLREIEQVAALAAGTIGMPATVAAWSWIRSATGERK